MELRDFSYDVIRKSELFAEVMSVCLTLLKHSDCAASVRDYLKTRIKNDVEGFSFGYFPDNDNINLLFQFIPHQTLEKLGLVYKKFIYDSGCSETIYNGVLSEQNLVMPYKNVYGDIVGLVGRRINNNDKASKYKNTSMLKGMNLFGIYESKNEILKKDSVIVVEGQFDCITCHYYGFKNTVALGGSAFTKFHFNLITRYTNNIILLLDNDFAGIREKNKILKRYGKLANIFSIDLPDCYKDIDGYLKNNNDHSLLK